MKLTQFREQYPEYDDMTDEEVIAEYDIEVGEDADLVVPALYDIEEKLENLCASVQAIVIPDHSADVMALLKQIKNALGSLEVAVNKIDMTVNVPAPVVKVTERPIPELKLPEPITSWKFEISRDRNGFIQSVTARA